MLGTSRDPCLLEPGVAVLVAADLDSGQGGHAPLKAIRTGSLGHLAHDPGAVGHEQSLVVQHQLLVLGKVLIVGLCGGNGVGVGSQLVDDVKAGLCLRGIPDAFLIVGGLVEELRAAGGIHQCVEERIKVAGGGVGEQVGALSGSLVAQCPHLVPGLGHVPALFLQETGVVEQAAGAVEHGSQIGLAVAVGVGQGGVGKAACDLLAHLLALAGHGHAQHIGDVGDQVALDELLGQGSFTAGGQMDHVGVVAALHGGANDVLQLLVGGQLHLDAGLGGKGLGDLLPHLSAIAGLDGSDLDGHVLCCGRSSSRRCRAGCGGAGRTAAGGQAQCSGTHASHFQKIATRNAFHSVSSIIKFRSKHSRGKQASSEGAVVFSASNIEVFTVRNKVFVVSFFRNIAFLEILSAKALKLVGVFWNISPSVTNSAYFCTPSKAKVLNPSKNQGLHFFFIASIMRKNARKSASFLGLYF